MNALKDYGSDRSDSGSPPADPSTSADHYLHLFGPSTSAAGKALLPATVNATPTVAIKVGSCVCF